jgi:uncharacterized protein (TIGR02270 family)
VLTILHSLVDQTVTLANLHQRTSERLDYALFDLAKLDHRLEAHIDSLRILGDDGWQLCLEALSKGDAFPGAVLAFESNDLTRAEPIHAAVPLPLDQLIAALGWLPPGDVLPRIQPLLQSTDPDHRTIGVAAAGFHRIDPCPALTAGINSDLPSLRARALQTLGELGPAAYHYEMDRGLTHNDDANCRFWAAWSASLLGDICTTRSWPLDNLISLAESGGLHCQEAAAMASRRLAHIGRSNDALAWHKRLADSGQIRTAVRVAQALADPVLIPWLIELMREPSLSRVAGEAFSHITGTDIAYLDLDLKEPPVPISNEPPVDAMEPPDEDQDLAWPDPALVTRWWKKYQAGFAPGTRYLLGKPLSADSALHALKFGYQRQRAAAALELAFMRQPVHGCFLYNTAKPGFRQMREFGLSRKDFRRPSPEW